MVYRTLHVYCVLHDCTGQVGHGKDYFYEKTIAARAFGHLQ